MRLSPRRILTANARRKHLAKAKLAELAADTMTVSARHQSKKKTLLELTQHASNPRKQARRFFLISFSPKPVGLFPK